MLPVGESTTGALPITQGPLGVAGLPATFAPPSSFHATAPASCESDASRATPAAGTTQSTAAGSGGGWSTPWIDLRGDRADRLRAAVPFLEHERHQLPVGGDVDAVEGEPTSEVSSHGVKVLV